MAPKPKKLTEVEELKQKLADRVDRHDKDGKALVKALNELDAYKRAKQENDERFIGERDTARAELKDMCEEKERQYARAEALQAELAEHKKWAEEELANAQRQANAAVEDLRLQVEDLRRQKEALIKEGDDAASRIVELQAMFDQKKYPSESCKEEREAGNGGCGACSLCCKEANENAARWKADYEGACKLVADMHAAAVGAVRGPDVGPVEDVAALRARYLELKKATNVVKTYNNVLGDIQAERTRQDMKWGQQNHKDGTGHPAAKDQADAARGICDHYTKIGQLTWMHILSEEMLEAFAETDQDKLRVELIQAAAVATAWAECIDRRKHERAPGE